MGSGHSVNITITLDREHAFFYAGESVSGNVVVNINEGEVKVDEVFVLLNGEAGYTTRHTVSSGPYGSTHSQNVYHTKRFLTEKQTLESKGISNEELIFHPGQYSWRFNIVLPSQIPPTFNQPRKYPHVQYYLKFVIDKPWYKRNEGEILYLTVFPHVDLSSDPQFLASSAHDNHNRKDVTLKCSLDRLAYTPGETITGTVEITNPHRVLLKEIHLSLIQHCKVESEGKKQTIVETTLPVIIKSKDEHIAEEFSLDIPHEHLPPSY